MVLTEELSSKVKESDYHIRSSLQCALWYLFPKTQVPTNTIVFVICPFHNYNIII